MILKPSLTPRLLMLAALAVYQPASVVTQSGSYYESIQQLHQDVLTNYNKQVIPLVDKQTPLAVSVSLSLQTFEFNEHHAQFSAKGYFRMAWKDPRLAWNPESYDGVSTIHLADDLIWTPDLEVYNSPGKLIKERTFASTVTYIVSNGTVLLVPFNSFDAICNPNPVNYPNDEVTCTAIVGSWTHSTKSIKFNLQGENAAVDIANLREVPGWKLISTNAETVEKIYDCCPDEPYQSLEISFVIQRKVPSSVFALTIPSVLIAVLTLGSFLIPLGSNSRITLGMLTLIMTCSYLLYFHSIIPAVGATPLIVQYYGAMAILVTISLLQTAISLGLMNMMNDRCCLSKPSNSYKNFFGNYDGLPVKDSKTKNATGNGASKCDGDEINSTDYEDSTKYRLTRSILNLVDRGLLIGYAIVTGALIKAYII